MNERIKALAEAASVTIRGHYDELGSTPFELEKFANLIIKECINKIETYQISVGNSAAGEMACDWTYDALKEIRTDIKETFGLR